MDLRVIQFPNDSIACSAIGFGCAYLMGRIGRKQSERALGTAFDCGVTFFDTARSYGWGRSEQALGQFLKGKRDKVVVCTKFGILPPRRNRFREFLKPVARAAMATASRIGASFATRFIRGRVQSFSSKAVRSHVFDMTAARASFEQSLTELNTDFVDILLLHGPTFEDAADGAIFQWLESEVTRGRVRAFGVSTGHSDAVRIAAAHPSIRVLQVPNSLYEPFDFPESCTGLGIIGNAPFESGLASTRLAECFGKSPELLERLPVGLAANRSEIVGNALLGFALATNYQGVTVCGMHTPARIVANTRLASSDFLRDRRFWESFGERIRGFQPSPETRV